MFQIVHLWKKCTAKPLPSMVDQAVGCLDERCRKSRRCFRSAVGLGLISVLGWVRAVETMVILSHPSRAPSQSAAFLLYDLIPWLRFGSVLAQGD